MKRNYLKVVLMLWTYNIAFDTSETAAVVRGSINPWDNKQKYCGKLLTRAIEIVCVEMKIKRRPRDTVRQVVARHSKNLLLQKSCCDDQCSLNFIKANCPVKRKKSNKKNKNKNKKNPSVVQSPVNSTQKSITTRTNTIALPLDKLLRPNMKNATISTSATTTTSTSTTPTSTTPTSTTPTSTTPTSTTPTSTTPTSTTPTSTTPTSTTPTSTTTTTTTTTTEEPSLSLEDYEFYLGFSP